MRKILILVIAAFLFGCTNNVEDTVASAYSSVYRLHEGNEAVCTSYYIGDNLFVTAFHCVDTKNPNSDFSIDLGSNSVPVQLITFDSNADVAILWSQEADIYSKPLKFWGGSELRAGQQIVSLGYPGYFGTNFAVEVNYIFGEYIINKDKYNERTYIFSKGMTYFGESGGPVLDVRTGAVIGMVDRLDESMEYASHGKHIHNTVSLIIPYDYIEPVIDEAKDQLLEFN